MGKSKRVKALAVADGWENVITGHNTTRDKRIGARPMPVAPSTDRQSFEDIYHGDDIAAKVVDRPAHDMVRKWVRITADMGDSAASNDAADDMLQALDVLGARGAFMDGLTWARVFGGALLFIGADDGGGSDPASMAEPLNENRIRSITSLDVYDRWDVEIESEYSDPLNPKFGQPETYRLNTLHSATGMVTTPTLVIHETRTLRFDGVRVNRRRLQRNNGWHDSVYIRLGQVLADYGISWGSVATLLSDFAPAVFKMAGLSDAIATDASKEVLDRLRLMDLCRSTIRMTPIDDDEEFDRHVTPVSGLPELLDRFMLRMASAADQPVTVLFGQSPSGLNNTAEGDLSVWYDKVQSMQGADVKPPLERLINLLWLSATGPTGGRVPKSWALDFEPLWQMSQKEEAEARNVQSKTDAAYIDTGVLTPEEVAESRFGGDRYSFETQLDQDQGDREREPQEP